MKICSRLLIMIFLISSGCGTNEEVVEQPETTPETIEAKTLEITEPTIVAFCIPDTSSESFDIADDFFYHTSEARPAFNKIGIVLYEQDEPGLSIEDGDQSWPVPFSDDQLVGYILISPDREPELLSGVHTDIELIQAAEGYFSISILGSPSP